MGTPLIRLGLGLSVLAVLGCSGSDKPREPPDEDALGPAREASTAAADDVASSDAEAQEPAGADLPDGSAPREAAVSGAPDATSAAEIEDAALQDAGVNSVGVDGGSELSFEGAGTPWREPLPRAKCAADDQADTTLQGLNGDLRCNVRLVGEVEAPLFLAMAWHGDCAYVNGPDGTSVIHVAPDGKPSLVTTLTELGFRNNWESMKVSASRGLLAGYEANGTTFAVYDVSADCKAPVLQSSIRLELGALGSLGHAGGFSPDGTIYYATSMFTADVFAVDLTAPKQLQVLSTTFERAAHELYIAKGGNRGYFANPDFFALGVGSVAVMDLSQIQARAPNAKGTLISELQWQDGSISQYPMLLNYGGKDFLMISEEFGSGNCDDPEKPPYGYARLFDMSDEKRPSLASLLKLEVQDPKHCAAAMQAAEGTELGTHYCNVDRVDNPRLLSCGEWDAGVRVFDIRNPWRPKEVAYFDTPSANVPTLTRIYAEKRELWLAATPGIFYVLKFPEGSIVDQILAD